MCGIVGAYNLIGAAPVDEQVILQMLAMIRHRGPDGFGAYLGKDVGLGSARLSIIDVSGGDQPIGNEDGTLWIVFNGEVFNYVELRPDLEKRGHRFTTATDTEVVLHLYEEFGPGCLRFLNGQFALAIWDERQQSLFLARDRMGIRPLFYTRQAGRLVFASEIKAILAHPEIHTELNTRSLEQVFTFWSVLSPGTSFQNIYELPPAHYMIARQDGVSIQPYWHLDFEEDGACRPAAEYLDEFQELLIDATRIRLRSDVPVGAYLSGGLDSSLTAAIIRKYTGNPLDTFSIAFSDPEYDESPFQKQMASYLGTDHQVVYCTYDDIGRVFPDVVWHTESPVLRTAPAPMFLLSELVHQQGYKVVMTGEGADEVLAGYDIFKEMKLRRFWARQPDSKLRPLLLQRLYPDISGLSAGAYLEAFFRKGLTDTGSPFYSHAIRWQNSARTLRFRSGYTPSNPFMDAAQLLERLPAAYLSWSPLAQAQYLEMITFLSPYLLSSQGDRVAMAHSVEGRFPFLDYRVIEFANRLPASLKLSGLTDKWLLRQVGRKMLPSNIWKRTKRPYRAPIHRSFFTTAATDYVRDLLSERELASNGFFEPSAVSGLVRKAQSGLRMSEVDDMALVGILSTQLLYQRFIKDFHRANLEMPERYRLIDRSRVAIEG